MQHLRLRTLALLLFSALGLAGMSHAQGIEHIVNVNVPFDFTANDLTFPSGSYSLVATPGRLELRDSQNHLLTWLLPLPAMSARSESSTKLQFSTEGGGHALYRVWLQGESFGYELVVPKSAEWARQ